MSLHRSGIDWVQNILDCLRQWRRLGLQRYLEEPRFAHIISDSVDVISYEGISGDEGGRTHQEGLRQHFFLVSPQCACLRLPLTTEVQH